MIAEAWGPSREWWAGFGTVTAALEGFGLAGFEAAAGGGGGKCLFLYVLSTPSSNYASGELLASRAIGFIRYPKGLSVMIQAIA